MVSGRVVDTVRYHGPSGSLPDGGLPTSEAPSTAAWADFAAACAAAACTISSEGTGTAGGRAYPPTFFGFSLLVGERGQATGAPVDDVFPPVDQVLFVEAHEHLADRPAEPFVERKAGAIPSRSSNRSP